MGNINAVSLPKLQKEAQSGMYDVILHVGDFAYDMNNVSRVVSCTLVIAKYIVSIFSESTKHSGSFFGAYLLGSKVTKFI